MCERERREVCAGGGDPLHSTAPRAGVLRSSRVPFRGRLARHCILEVRELSVRSVQ